MFDEMDDHREEWRMPTRCRVFHLAMSHPRELLLAHQMREGVW